MTLTPEHEDAIREVPCPPCGITLIDANEKTLAAHLLKAHDTEDIASHLAWEYTTNAKLRTELDQVREARDANRLKLGGLIGRQADQLLRKAEVARDEALDRADAFYKENLTLDDRLWVLRGVEKERDALAAEVERLKNHGFTTWKLRSDSTGIVDLFGRHVASCGNREEAEFILWAMADGQAYREALRKERDRLRAQLAEARTASIVCTSCEHLWCEHGEEGCLVDSEFGACACIVTSTTTVLPPAERCESHCPDHHQGDGRCQKPAGHDGSHFQDSITGDCSW